MLAVSRSNVYRTNVQTFRLGLHQIKGQGRKLSGIYEEWVRVVSSESRTFLISLVGWVLTRVSSSDLDASVLVWAPKSAQIKDRILH